MRLICLCLCFCLGLLTPALALAQSPATGPVWLGQDPPGAAGVDFDTSDWAALASLPDRPNGVFWIRDELVLASPAGGFENPVMMVEAAGAYEVFLDGVLIGRGGRLTEGDQIGPAAPEFAHFSVPPDLLTQGRHIVAVRASADMLRADQAFFFTFGLHEAETVVQSLRGRDRIDGAAAFSALFLALAFLGLRRWRPGRADLLPAAAMCTCVFLVVLINPEARSFGHSVAADFWVEPVLFGLSLALFALVPVLLHTRLHLTGGWRWVMAAGLAIGLAMIPIGDFELDARAFGALMLLAAVMALSVWRQRPIQAMAHAAGALVALGAIVIEPELLTVFLAMTMTLLAVSLIVEIMSGEWLARKREARIARLQSDLVKRNIQPHFIMNSLTVAGELQETDPGAARRFVAAMADEFGALATIIDQPRVQLRQEIDLCRSHLAMMSLRLGHAFTLDVDGEVDDHEFPPGVLHTLLENAISHNRYGSDVRFSLESGLDGRWRIYRLRIPLGQARSASALSSGTGTRYVESRLEEFSPGAWSLTAREINGAWITEIRLKAGDR